MKTSNHTDVRDIFKAVAQEMVSDIQIGYSDYATTYFEYEDNGWKVKGRLEVIGENFRYSGGGCMDPEEVSCDGASGSVDDLEVECLNENGEYESADESDSIALWEHLDGVLDEELKDVWFSC